MQKVQKKKNKMFFHVWLGHMGFNYKQYIINIFCLTNKITSKIYDINGINEKMSIQGTLRRGSVRSGKYPLRNSPLGKCKSGTVHGEVSIEELSRYQFVSETFLVELF